jgi:hypothetical protein
MDVVADFSARHEGKNYLTHLIQARLAGLVK